MLDGNYTADPQRPRFARVPLIAVAGSTVRVERGTVDDPGALLRALLKQEGSPTRPGTVDGRWLVLTGKYGTTFVAMNTELSLPDYRFEFYFDIIGPDSGAEAAAWLSQLLEVLPRLHERGWVVHHEGSGGIRLVDPNFRP